MAVILCILYFLTLHTSDCCINITYIPFAFRPTSPRGWQFIAERCRRVQVDAQHIILLYAHVGVHNDCRQFARNE